MANSTHSAVVRLRSLRDLLAGIPFPLAIDRAERARDARDHLVHQLDDYVLPRYERLDAPLLAVVGGSTGAGKSTLVNSLLGVDVAASSAIRPTTRRPLLLHHPPESSWFEDDRILPSLARVRVAPDAPPTPASSDPAVHSELEIRSTRGLPQGLAIIDAPDIDSIVNENRQVAAQLLAAADLWLFVTTAARYADAVPWDLLRDAASRNTVVAIVLDRVPPEVVDEVRSDLRRRLVEAGLAEAPLFTIEESVLDGDHLPEDQVAPIRQWLGSLAADAASRSRVARQTLLGAVGTVLGNAADVGEAAQQQVVARDTLRARVAEAEQEALRRLASATADGSLLRGEVLARWQEFVGTGDFFRSVEAQVGRIRDRVSAFVRGAPAPTEPVETAIEEGLLTLLEAETQRAVADVDHAWRFEGGGRDLLAEALRELPTEARLRGEASRHVVEWQDGLLAMVREEGADRRFTARMLSLGVNGLGIALMITILASTGGVITGGELAAAGGTAVVGQKLLEAVFGEDAVRRMAKQARARLNEHGEQLLEWYLTPFTAALDGLGIDPDVRARVDAAVADVRAAQAEGGLA
ncbi:MAG: dynamin family protein [Actinomycetes bacterium]|nr:dynamin family protein [Actinomycetes bacterium]MDX5380578.1 dynamin family protein [Actinomycetes bacterium]MDX5450322.1 dynamin family protein [Actinomycetes bacterium]